MQSFLTNFQAAVGVKTAIKRPMKSHCHWRADSDCATCNVRGFCCSGGHNSRWKKQKLANGPLADVIFTSQWRYLKHFLQLKTLDNVSENMAKTLQQCSIVFRTPWPHVHKLLDVLLV